MTNKVLILGAAGLVLVVIGNVGRVGAVGPTPKIGFVDLQLTLNETKVGKAARAKLEGEKATKQKEVDGHKEELKKDSSELEKQRVILKPEAVMGKERALQEKYVKLQQKFVELQQDLGKKEALLTREVFGKAAKVIEDIAKRDGYTMILEKSESAILWSVPGLDITAALNKKLDEITK